MDAGHGGASVSTSKVNYAIVTCTADKHLSSRESPRRGGSRWLFTDVSLPL